jgi:hypothetical protein
MKISSLLRCCTSIDWYIVTEFLEEYSVLKIEALRCSETSVTTSRCNMPEELVFCSVYAHRPVGNGRATNVLPLHQTHRNTVARHFSQEIQCLNSLTHTTACNYCALLYIMCKTNFFIIFIVMLVCCL